ncbi:preprotein translocase subunit SecG [Candidatus Parcubacteria bacterium]|nr:preprotein translocase subunit SecG [Candidatus Parcubacteria bacterium]
MEHIKLAQLGIALLLILVILLQNRGAGVSGLFGGSGNVYLTKRGLEKKLFTFTIILSVFFFATSLAVVFYK